MAKKKREKKPREVTRRQLSRWQQQRKRERLVRYLGIFIITVILCLLGAGLYITQYQPLYETVITVNDAKFNMKYFINALKYYGQGQTSMTLYTMSREVERIIVQNELVRQGAMELDITVSSDEVNKELERRDPPLSKDYRDIIRTELLVDTLLDEYFEHQVPVFAEQFHVQAMFLESENQTLEVTERLEAGEDFGELAGELSLDGITKEQKVDLGWHPKDIAAELLNSPVAEEYAFNSGIGVLSPPLYDEEKIKGVAYWLAKILERKEDSDEVHIQTMQLGSEAEANKAKARLEAGEDFGEVAAELSHLDGAEENRGDVGWVSPGTLSSVLEEFVFDPQVELETISEVIRDDDTITTGGYWLVKVLGKEDNKEIDEEDRTLLKGKALNEWVTSLWDDPDNKTKSFLGDEKIAWAVEKAMGN